MYKIFPNSPIKSHSGFRKYSKTDLPIQEISSQSTISAPSTQKEEDDSTVCSSY